jgi:hypothetical protein
MGLGDDVSGSAAARILRALQVAGDLGAETDELVRGAVVALTLARGDASALTEAYAAVHAEVGRLLSQLQLRPGATPGRSGVRRALLVALRVEDVAEDMAREAGASI